MAFVQGMGRNPCKCGVLFLSDSQGLSGQDQAQLTFLETGFSRPFIVLSSKCDSSRYLSN